MARELGQRTEILRGLQTVRGALGGRHHRGDARDPQAAHRRHHTAMQQVPVRALTHQVDERQPLERILESAEVLLATDADHEEQHLESFVDRRIRRAREQQRHRLLAQRRPDQAQHAEPVLRRNLVDRDQQHARERGRREALERIAPQPGRLGEHRGDQLRLHVAQRVGQLLAGDLPRGRHAIGQLRQRLIRDLHRVDRPLRGGMHRAHLAVPERPDRLVSHRRRCHRIRDDPGEPPRGLARGEARQPDATAPAQLDGMPGIDHPVAHLGERRICAEPGLAVLDQADEPLVRDPLERAAIRRDEAERVPDPVPQRRRDRVHGAQLDGELSHFASIDDSLGCVSW